jgi:transcriptional regulator GlxA family with amidase domain
LAGLLLRCTSHQFGAAAAADIGHRLNVEVDAAKASQLECWSGLPAYCHPALRAAVWAIHRNLEMPLEISDICAAAGGVSERTLHACFGTIWGAYYRARRLEHARELLRLTPLSITEITLMAGFECPTHFSQCYRRYFSLVPRRDR